MTSVAAIFTPESMENFTDLTDEKKLEVTCSCVSKYLSLYFLDDNLTD